MSHVIRLRLEVSDSELRRLGIYHGGKRATLKEYRDWCLATIEVNFEDMPADPEWDRPSPHRQMDHHQYE